MREFLRVKENVIIIDNYLYPRVIKVSGQEGIVYPVNSTGVQMLNQCDGTKTIEEIAHVIARKYNVNPSMVKRDTKIFLEEKIRQGLVEKKEYSEKIEVDFRGKEDIILPYQLSVETTNQCQLRCKHCYNQSGEKRENELTVNEIIDVLKQYKELGGISVMLTGGEVFLKEDVTDLIDYVANNFERVVLLTNGYQIKEEIFYKLEEHKDRLALQISIDGVGDNHDFVRGIPGAFDRTIHNVKRFIEIGLTVSIASVLNEYNFQDIEELTKIVKTLGCRSISIGAVAGIGRAKETDIASVDIVKSLSDIVSHVRKKYADDTFWVSENIEEYEDKNEIIEGINVANRCGAGYKILHLFSNGKIGICPSNGSIINKFYVNDVRKATLYDILKYENMRYLLDITTPSKKLCGGCGYFVECGQCIVSMLSKPAEVCSVKRKLIDEKIIGMQV